MSGKKYRLYFLLGLFTAALASKVSAESGYFGADLVGDRIVSVYDFSPAALAGIRSGDTIVSVDGVRADHLGLQKLSGQAGSKVTIIVRRKGRLITCTAVRTPIPRPIFPKLDSADAYYVEGIRQLDCGYIATARLCLEEADSMQHKQAKVALKALLPLKDPSKTLVSQLKQLQMLEKSGRWKEALLLANTMCEANPASEQAYVARSSVLRQLGRYKEALICASQGLKINADYQPGLIELAYCQSQCGDKKGALQSLQKARLLCINQDLIKLEYYLTEAK